MALNKILLEQDARGRASVLSCSALKASYRRILSQGLRHPIWVYLDVDRQELIQRLQTRRGHFMPTDLLDSQFHTLEIPGEVEAIHIDGSKPVEGIVMQVKNALSRG
jgi:carbohydrate kinase (thermoresistant glucokinase family)